MTGNNNRTAVVTGAASGIGYALTLNLLQRGYNVVAIDINDGNLTSLDNARLTIKPCDVTDLSAVKNTIEFCENTTDGIDLLIHAAAIMPVKNLADMDGDTLKQVMDVNFFGAVNVVTTTLSTMRRRGRGRIVVFGSSAGYAPLPGIGAYCAAKAAINQYVETLAIELVNSPISVELVVPPAVDTPMTDVELKAEQHDIFKRAMRSAKGMSAQKYTALLLSSLLDKNTKGHIHRGARFVAIINACLPGMWRRWASR